MLRPLEKTDLELVLPWRNDPAVRQAMYSQHEITWEEHQLWFQRMQVDESARWYLYLNKDNEPNGVVYFTELNASHSSAFWGFYASPDATPGTGMRMSLDALGHAFKELRIQKVNSEVLASNPRSLEMHKKVGFIEEGCFREQFSNAEQRIDVVRLGMLASEWPGCRQVLEGRISELDALASQRQSDPPPEPLIS